MHELSIAQALIQQVREHRPPHAIVERVDIVIGPLHAIDKDAMELAWQVVTDHSDCHGVQLGMKFLPYRWHCRACGRQWTSEQAPSPCTCGYATTDWCGGDELYLESLEVNDAAACQPTTDGVWPS